MSARRWTAALAAAATATALSLSVLAGWQRGGTLPERIVWVATGVVLVVTAHLLPALIRDTPLHVRIMGGVLWAACLATACYGHAVFFVLAQQHAGEERAATVAVAPVTTPARSLTAVMADRAAVVRQLAWIDAQHCSRDCSARAARHATLTARLEALDAEAGEVRRRQAADDRVVAQRDALLADPVTSRLAALLGIATARVDLLSGLSFAAVLEGVACLLWWLALSPPSRPAPLPGVVATVAPVAGATDATGVAATAVVDSHVSVTASSEVAPESRDAGHETVTHSRDDQADSHLARDDPLPDTAMSGDDVARLAHDIAAGRVRPTVADIRRHLGCSQSRAIALRRQLAALSPAA